MPVNKYLKRHSESTGSSRIKRDGLSRYPADYITLTLIINIDDKDVFSILQLFDVVLKIFYCIITKYFLCS